MEDLHWLLAASGLLLGAIAGAAARATDLCSLTAIANVFYKGDFRMAWSWSVALFVAVLGTQALILLGLLDLSDVFYLHPIATWSNVVLGGILFGFGMAVVGTCGFGTLVRAGGGDLRAVIDAALIGIFSYVAIAGFLSVPRLAAIESMGTPVTLEGQGLHHLFRSFDLSEQNARLFVIAACVAMLVPIASRALRTAKGRMLLISGVLIGACIIGGWCVTGILGDDPFEPTALRSLSFVRPMGDGLLTLMLGGLDNIFGVMTVPGVVLGAWAVARHKGEFELESFEGGRETLRHMAGAALMGVGGILALGCTIGQGLSAMSTLAVTAPVALASMWAGAWLGLTYLEKGGLTGMFRAIRGAE